MSLIACTCDCIYQKEGRCALERAVSRGEASGPDACVHCIPRYHAANTGKAPR